MNKPSLEELVDYKIAAKYAVTFALGNGESELLVAIKTLMDENDKLSTALVDILKVPWLADERPVKIAARALGMLPRESSPLSSWG